MVNRELKLQISYGHWSTLRFQSGNLLVRLLEVPGIDSQNTASCIVSDSCANTNSDNIIQPKVSWISGFINEPKDQLSSSIYVSSGPHINVSTVFGKESIAGVWIECPSIRINGTPVGSKVKDSSYFVLAWGFEIGISHAWPCSVPVSLGPVKLPPTMGITRRSP